MTSSTPTFRRARIHSVDTMLTTCRQADDSSRRNQTTSRRHAYSDPNVQVHLLQPFGRKKSGEGVYLRSPVNRLLRRRSTNLTTLSSYKNDEDSKTSNFKSFVEKILTTGEQAIKNLGEGGRKLSYPDLMAQNKYVRIVERRRSKLLQMKRSTTKRLLYRKFRRVARLVVFCIRECSNHSLSNNDDDELSPFLKPLHFRDYTAMAGVELMFDPSKFKANKQTRISDDIKKILSKPPKERTGQDLYSAQIAMRNIKCFQEYPARMQRLIAEVGVYESFEARRVLVRQGHPASSFYFILSGTVVVMVMDFDRKYARPVAYLCKGQTFGELAIINRTSRQSTVIAKETSEFLTISVNDYHRIFMAGGVKCITDPDHDSFLRNLNFFEGWPLKKLEEQPSKCLFLYFKRGDVLVKDSHYSDWLIIVKSGSISILKKLRRVKAFESKCKPVSHYIREKNRHERERKRQQWRTSVLPELHVQLRKSVDEDTEYNEDGTVRMFCHPEVGEEAKDTVSCRYFNSQVWQFGSTKDGKRNFTVSHIPNLVSSRCFGPRSGSFDVNLETTIVVRSPRRRRDVRPHSFSNVNGSSASSSSDKVTSLRGVHRSSDHISMFRRASFMERQREMMGFEEHVRTIGEDLDAGFKRKDPDDVTPADLNPEFVKVQTLTKGQVFGLADVFLGKQTSFCVVSNGADCLLVNKQLYRDHVTDDLFRKMRQELCPYPSEEVLQASLQTSVDWSAYRETTLANTLKLVKQRKAPA